MARRLLRSRAGKAKSKLSSSVGKVKGSFSSIRSKFTIGKKPMKISGAGAKVVKATQKGKTTLGRQISSFKKPWQRMKTTAVKSTKLKRLFSKIAVPKIRTGKILGNVPAKFSKLKLPGFKLPKLPKLPSAKFPKLPTFKLPKLPKFGFPKLPSAKFPKLPKLPDVPGFVGEKVEDVVDSVKGFIEGGKKRLFIVVVAIVLVFLGLMWWKKK